MKHPINLGLMVPMNNTTMERELLAWLPKGSTCTTLKIPRGKGLLTSDTLPQYIAQAVSLAEEFARYEIDVVAFGCTAASFLSGPKGDAELARTIAQVTGKPTVTTAHSMAVALKALQAKNIAVVTPYADAVNDLLKAFIECEDINVRRLSSFNVANVEELAAIPSSAVADRAKTVMGQDCDALFIACSQLPTFDIIKPLEQVFQKPVLSSIQVTAQQALLAGNNNPKKVSDLHNRILGSKAVAALVKNDFTASYVNTRQEAIDRVLSLVDVNATIGVGGSWTLHRDLKLVELLEQRGHTIFDHNKLGCDKSVELRRKQLAADVFLTSTNAITLDGKLVNVDGAGNRVAAMIFGPKKVIVVAGVNKIVRDVAAAEERIELFAAPMNSLRKGSSNPCTVTGTCTDCQGPACICKVTTIMRKRPTYADINIIIVGEELGF
jgi:maleate cis-trans isomerase